MDGESLLASTLVRRVNHVLFTGANPLHRRRIMGNGKWPSPTPPTYPVRKPEFLKSRNDKPEYLRATWLGHACYYVEFPNGLRVLFDPVFEERCSPISIGPVRYTAAPCNPADIPIIDVVIISHSHYDHLSHPTVIDIQKHHPNVLFAVPLGLKKASLTLLVKAQR